LETQAETGDHRISIAEDVPVLRIDHASTKSLLRGMWQGPYCGGALDFKEMSSRYIQVL
jgi:hypothetical protein